MPNQTIAPSTHLRQALHGLLQQGIEQEESPTSALLGLAARVVLQEALERAARGWQRIHIGESEQRQLAALRRELGLDPPPTETAHHYQKIAARGLP